MKSIAIMQPYFFPYIGYWQLIQAVDVFVIYDDVQYIKRGWINRNRILYDGKDIYINLPVKDVSSTKRINEIVLDDEIKRWKTLEKRIITSYKKCKEFDNVYKIIDQILGYRDKYAIEYLDFQVRSICECLNVKTKIFRSSDLKIQSTKRGQERILEICKLLEAEQYINPIGGTGLYDKELFQRNGIELDFLRARLSPYKQFDYDFVPALSIIDVLMFNGLERAKDMLNDYDLL